MYKLRCFISLLALFVLYKAEAQDSLTLAIENVTVIPMTGEMLMVKQRVLVAGGKIIKIEPASIPLQTPVALTIDGTGKYLIPGLSEMHYHFRSKDIESDFKLLIANGITTVRNMAEGSEDQMQIKRKTLSGDLWPFTYFTTGPYLTAKDLESEEQVTLVVKRHKEKGYDFLKLADNLPKPVYLKLLNECEANNLPVVGHSQRAMPLEFSLRMKAIEHIEEFCYLSKDANSIAYLKQNTAGLQNLARQLEQSRIYLGTTLAGFEFITNCLNDKKFDSLQHSPLTKYLAKDQRAAFLTENNDYRKLRHREFDGVKAAVLFNNYFNWMKNFAHILALHRIPLLTGSDTYGMVVVGFSLHHEFELLQQAGMRPYDILLASTVTPARFLNVYGQQGTISEGKNADMVLLNKNPLTDIKNTAAIAGVFLKGKWFGKTQIDAMLKQVEAAYK